MAKAKREQEAKEVREKTLNKQKSNYQQPNQSTMKANNSSFEFGHSRLHNMLSKREESKLTKFAILAVVSAAIILYFEWSGAADWWVNKLASIISFII